MFSWMSFKWRWDIENNEANAQVKPLYSSEKGVFGFITTTMMLVGLLLVLGNNLVTCYDTSSPFQAISSGIQSSEIPVIEEFSFSKNIRLGRKTTLTCSVVSGSEPLTFEWLKDQRPVHPTSDILIAGTRSSSIITLSPVSSSHAGNWTCQVKNDVGVTSHTASLDVERESHLRDRIFG